MTDVNVTNSLINTAASPSYGIDHGGTILAAATWQMVAVRNPNRVGAVQCSNTSSTLTDVMYFKSSPLPPTNLVNAIPCPVNSVVTIAGNDNIWVYGMTIGKTYTAREVSRAVTGVAGKYPAGSRMGGCVGVTTNTAQQVMYTKFCRNGAVPLTNLLVRLPGFYVPATGIETDNPNDLRVTISIEYPIGTTPKQYQVDAVNLGNIIVKAGVPYVEARIDASILPVLPAFAPYLEHMWYSGWINGAPGGVTPYGRYCSSVIGDGYIKSSTTTTDLTLTIGGTTASTGNTVNYQPIFRGGDPVNGEMYPSVVITGDSIDNGSGESTIVPPSMDANGNIGAPERLFGSTGIGLVNISAPGTTAAQWAVAGAMTKRLACLADVGSAIFCGLGRNDVAGTAAQIQTSVGAVIAQWTTKGRRAFVRTIPPITTGTFTSAGGQSTGPNEATRAAYNVIVRAFGIPGALGYMDYDLSVRDAAAITKWRSDSGVAYTPDGTHPYAVANIQFVLDNQSPGNFT